jgi:hypothetical protein
MHFVPIARTPLDAPGDAGAQRFDDREVVD